jgi:3-carboxy-cis,cis-muconate cycloisomerase
VLCRVRKQARMSDLLDPLFGRTALSPIFADRGRIQAMLDFEAALTAAQARCGIVPKSAVAAIKAQCRAELFDLGALGREAANTGNPAIPLVKHLTAKVRAGSDKAARYVHWGATSQDVMDTGLVLQLRQAIAIVEQDLAALSKALAALAKKHRNTPMAGRTWLQQALPITFGLKVAGWLDALQRHRARLNEIKPRLLVVQLGGAAGTLASLGDSGQKVVESLAQELKLGAPDLPWHAERDRLVEFASWLGTLAGIAGKIARDVSLMMQSEIGEAFEAAGEGKGGSSTMPHKRNPVACASILAAATRAPGLVASMLAAMPQDHERGLGGWHAEWETLPELTMLAGGTLNLCVGLIDGLEVDADRMRRNLDATQGLIMAEALAMALAQKIGKADAHHLVEAACKRAVKDQRHLRQIAGADPAINRHFNAQQLDRLFDPAHYTGAGAEFIARVLAAKP